MQICEEKDWWREGKRSKWWGEKSVGKRTFGHVFLWGNETLCERGLYEAEFPV